MKKGGVGGALTQKSGENFEKKTLSELVNLFIENGFFVEKVIGDKLSPRSIKLKNKMGKDVDFYFKAAVHKDFFEPRNILSSKFFSARLEPDTAIFSNATNTLTIIEKKQQTTSGSVAEKLQTCDFKLRYYKTLCNPINVKVDLIWQLGSYFLSQQKNLQSVFDYMEEKGSRYFFTKIPFEAFKI